MAISMSGSGLVSALAATVIAKGSMTDDARSLGGTNSKAQLKPGTNDGSAFPSLSQRSIVIIDEIDQRDQLNEALSPKYRTHWATSVDQGLTLWRSVNPEIVVVSLEMPGTGLDALLEIRRSSAVPVIAVSSDNRDETCVLALRLGADDYVVKPFSVTVLAARVDTVLRRGTGVDEAVGVTTAAGDLHIDFGSRQVFVQGDEVHLTPIEFDVLALLASQPRRVFTREHLLQSVWDSNPEWQSLATVTEHVRRLRLKLGPASSHVTTVFSRGYRFDL